MRPKLFRLNDLSWLWILITIVALICVGVIWNYFSKSGEHLPLPAYIVSGVVIVSCSVVIILFYWMRWKFISMWKFTTDTGIACYFEPNMFAYTRHDVEIETDIALLKWADYLKKEEGFYNTRPLVEGCFVRDSICIFKAAKIFIYLQPGYIRRKVYGIAGWNWCMVGKGNLSINETAYKHEISHILLNRYMKINVLEEKSHKIFEEVGV